jgi:hypothetical protein
MMESNQNKNNFNTPRKNYDLITYRYKKNQLIKAKKKNTDNRIY